MEQEATNLKEIKPKVWAWPLWGCLVPAASLFVLSVVIAVVMYFWTPEPKSPEFVKDTEPKVERRLEELERKEQVDKEAKAASYDLDATVSALYSMEQALAGAKNFEQLNDFILQRDPNLVDPEVLALKYKFFKLYKDILQDRDDLDKANSVYSATAGALLDLASLFDPVTMTYSRDQAQKVWNERIGSIKLSREIRNRLLKSQDAFVDFLFDYMKISSVCYRKWERLCAARDRAYLAAYEGDWKEAIANSSSAVNMAPHEKEAHILMMMSLLEQGSEIGVPAAKASVDAFLKDHPSDATGLLIKGVIAMKEGRHKDAVIDFDQAAAYFPKLQEEVNDRLSIYKKRSFLNKSQEGRVIVNMYRSMMSGSGYFSPDFQKARVLLAKGQADEAKAKIFDHFFRRRRQGEWDKVLSDFKYSNKFLGTDLFNIGATKISLSIEPAFFTNSVVLAISNDSKEELHNLTVLLCVRFTDMFKGDYISFPVGETVALLKPGETVTIGRRNISDVTESHFGSTKKFKDIIEYAAVIISDESISWVEAKKVEDVKDAPQASSPAETLIEKGKEAVNQALDKTVKVIGDELLSTERPADSPDKK